MKKLSLNSKSEAVCDGAANLKQSKLLGLINGEHYTDFGTRKV